MVERRIGRFHRLQVVATRGSRRKPSTTVHRVRRRRRALAVPLLSVLIGATGFVLSLPTTTSAASFGHPTITAADATYKIPAGTGAMWTLNLWSHGTVEGTATGMSGMLTVVVPTTSDCAFQADVRAITTAGAPFYFAGIRATVPGCGSKALVQSISGHIYQCTAGSPTTTEVPGGTLAATGPTAVVTQPNPVTPIAVPAGSYTVSAGSPDGFTFVLCGAAPTIGSAGRTASETVAIASGGAGVALFYVTGPPVAAGGATNGSSPGAPVGAVAVVSSATATAGPATKAAVTPVAGSQLAFTGMDPAPPVLLGLLLIALGSLLVIFSRARRVPHPRPARAGAATPPVPRRP